MQAVSLLYLAANSRHILYEKKLCTGALFQLLLLTAVKNHLSQAILKIKFKVMLSYYKKKNVSFMQKHYILKPQFLYY